MNKLKIAIAFLRYIITGSPMEEKSHMYERFIKTPSILSFFLAVALLLSTAHLLISVLREHFPFFSGLMLGVVAVLGVPMASGIRAIVRDTATRSRMRQFAATKFDSWEEFGEWIQNTSPESLDAAAGLPDDKWLPAKGGGIIRIKDDESTDGRE